MSNLSRGTDKNPIGTGNDNTQLFSPEHLALIIQEQKLPQGICVILWCFPSIRHNYMLRQGVTLYLISATL